MLESGPLSEKKFPAFAEKVVPFLHITTRIPGHPYDSLLREMGGTGFPTLMFLDADGRRIQRHNGPRTTKGFESGLEEVQAFQELQAKAEAGDAKAKVEVFMRQLELEWFDFDTAKAKLAELGELPKKQAERIQQLMVDTEVRTLIANAKDDAAKLKEAGARFLEMWNEKLVPEAQERAYEFWTTLADHVEEQGDKKAFKDVVAEFKDKLKNTPMGRSTLKKLEERLKKFKKK